MAICEPGQRVTNQFECFGAEFGRCKWNKLPIEIQRVYLIFLTDTQQPKILQSFGGMHKCTRDTFKQVCIFNWKKYRFANLSSHLQIIAKGFSYFMTLRKFRV